MEPGVSENGGPRWQADRRRIRIQIYFLFFLLALVAAAFIYVVRMFMVPVLLALAIAAIFHPAYEWLERRLGGRSSLAAFIACLAVLLVVVIPLYLVGSLLVGQLIGFIRSIQSADLRHLLEAVQNSRVSGWLQRMHVDWQQVIQSVMGSLGGLLTTVIDRTTSGVIGLFTTLFIMLFTLFYFFRDGRRILGDVRFLAPMQDHYQDLLMDRFVLISRATLIGTVTVALIHGTLGAITLLIFGVKTWLLWGVVIATLGFIPPFGPWVVLVPVGVIKIATGHTWQGIALFLISTALVASIDNLLRPRLVGHSARMHDLLIFFSTLGGIAVFGIVGFIVGPVIAALFITLLSIYGMEFHEMLDSPEDVPARAPRRKRRAVP